MSVRALCLGLAVTVNAWAADLPSSGQVMPEGFLHLWDPVTIFFNQDLGPAGGVALDGERFLRVSPPTPGAYLWLNPRTLQFRPSLPWRAFAQYQLTTPWGSQTLVAVPDPPERVEPGAGAEVEEVAEFSLSFSQPVNPQGLAEAVRVTITPQGEKARARRFSGRELEQKTLESGPGRRSTYLFRFPNPLPPASQVTVELVLPAGGQDVVWHSWRFATAEAFLLTGVRCGDRQLTIPPSGLRTRPSDALPCALGDSLALIFSRDLQPPSLLDVRNLVRLTPAVPDWTFEDFGRELIIRGSFAPETTYRLDLTPAPLRSRQGKPLAMEKPSVVYLAFPEAPKRLSLAQGFGFAERFGPRMVPVAGQGEEVVEVTLLPVDGRKGPFWAFPSSPLSVEEGDKPAPPGGQASLSEQPMASHELREVLRSLPAVATRHMVSLPLSGTKKARFGLDLAPLLRRATGQDNPSGMFLVGLRRPQTTTRQWMQVQVSDLSLTTAERDGELLFAISSLASGEPLAQVQVEVEGELCGRWQTLMAGKTGNDGLFVPQFSLAARCPSGSVAVAQPRRILLRKETDQLVLDCQRPPQLYFAGRWTDSSETWLQWSLSRALSTGAPPATLAHLFPERPVYRPEEEVHLKGYVRLWNKGRLALTSEPVTLVVAAPGGRRLRFPLTLTPYGSFYHQIREENLPTGAFDAWVEDAKGNRLASTSFRIEAYRVPDFEVELTAPEAVPLDRPFEVKLVATYYAGGKAAGQPVRFRVSQFPEHWQAPAWEGFAFSSDARYGEGVRFRTQPAQVVETVTDDQGAASLTLNPAAEESLQPRLYLVEATVVGTDDQTVTTTRRVRALPPFVLGLKVPRYLPAGKEVEAQVLAVDGQGQALAGQSLTVRLKKRSWHSVLQASDFTLDAPKYLTSVVDELVEERALVSEDKPVTLRFSLREAGVYLVEVESRDRLGRSQRVGVDFFADGEAAVSWPRKESKTFRLVATKPKFAPGEMAEFLLESPYQKAWGLVVVEAPTGNRYQWVRVEGGKGSFQVPVEGSFAPSIPVHCLLMRGRVSGVEPLPGSAVDLGKPATAAASASLVVEPLDKRVFVTLEHASKAQPGDKLKLTVRLRDEKQQPLAGEVTLWLVDLAVLSLGKEQPLDPLPSFLQEHRPRTVLRDTRNLLFGLLPLVELPGGEQGPGEEELVERNTVRRRFQSVPYYNPSLEVGPSGVAEVEIPLPDNLTVFAVRAKAVSGPERFGYATSRVEVRRPLVAQLVLPRFLRFGDRLELGLLARVVEGSGGPAKAKLTSPLLGVTSEQNLTLATTRPASLKVAAQVPELSPDATGSVPSQVTVRGQVERLADGARDALEVSLPLRLPYQTHFRREVLTLSPEAPLELPPVPPEAKPGTIRRQVVLAAHPAVAKVVAALSFLHEYPYGCTEQRLARARSFLAHKTLLDTLQLGGRRGLEAAVEDTLAWLPRVLDQDHLVAFWPQSQGNVFLTAWSLQFLLQAEKAGFAVSGQLKQQLVEALQRVLRGQLRPERAREHWDRSWALIALAQAGQLDLGSTVELARRSQFLDLESKSQVVLAFARGGLLDQALAKQLAGELADAVLVRSYQGQLVYGGLQGVAHPTSPMIFPTETRVMASLLQALNAAKPKESKLPLLLEALVRLGQGDGWGNTNANAAACLALAEVLREPPNEAVRQVRVEQAGGATVLTLDREHPLPRWLTTRGEAAKLLLTFGEPLPVIVETSYLPAVPTPAGSAGFVLQRQWLVMDKEGNVRQRLTVEPQTPLALSVGDVVEEHLELVNPEDRAYVAVVAPLAAGLEPLNPALATAPPEAQPKGQNTLVPTFTDFRDDQASFFYDWLPKGTYHLYFRTRAQVSGRFYLPAATVELMYQQGVRGWSAASVVEIAEKP